MRFHLSLFLTPVTAFELAQRCFILYFGLARCALSLLRLSTAM